MAEGKSGDLTEQIAEIAECPICTDKIKNNRMLPCGHTFCLKCLEQYKKTSKVKGKSLPCPICRREFAIPKGGCAMFPKNIIVEKLLKVENVGKEENDVTTCDTCETGNRSNAVVHCIECDQSLCSECDKLHGRLKVSATHHVVPVSKNSHFHAARRTYCEEHPEYLLELMCYDCDKTICWKCRSLTHADHKAADMKDLADGYCEQLQSNIEQIDSRLSVLSKITENITDQERQYQENFEKDKANVSKTAASLIRNVVSNEDKLIKLLSSALQRNLKSLQPHKQQVQAQMDSLKQHKTSVKELKESGDSLKILEDIADLHSKANELLSASIISINEPTVLSTMTESEIQKHLIGANVATTADGTATSQTATTTGTVFRNKPLPATRTTLRKPESLSLQSPQDDRNAKAASEWQPDSPSQAVAGTISRGKSLPPATLKKPELKHSQSVQSQTQDDRSMKAESESKSSPASANTPTSEIYSNCPPLPPPPELPLRSILPLSRSASGRSTQSSTAAEQQPPAKDAGSTIAMNIGSSAASFSVGDGSAVFGVAVHKQKIYVATENSPDISVYSVEEHSLLHTLVVPGLKQASDMTFCHRYNCLYLIDWIVRSIFRVEVEGGKEITRWNTEEFGGLSISAEATVILAGHETNCLKEYTTSGTLIRTVKLKSDVSESIRPWHAVKLAFDHGTLASDRYLVSHGSSSDTSLHRVCLVDADGQIIKSFGGLRGRGKNSLSGPYHLCITEDRRLFVADCNNGRIVVLDENLEFVDEIAGNLRKPRRICLDKTSNKLFVTDNKLVAKKASDGRIVILSEVLYSQTFCLA